MTQFRQALVYGINQTDFVQQAYSGYGATAYNAETATPTSAGIWYNPNIQQYNYNFSKAKALLENMGMTYDSSNHLHWSNGTAASLTLWTDTDNTEDLTGANVVQTYLQNLGFNVNMQTGTQADLAANYGANSQGIRNALLLFSGFVLNPPHPLVDALPACDVEWLPPICGHNFLWPPSADAQYQSNLTAFLGTANQAQVQRYIYNIQSLEAQSLPTTILAYPDFLWGYSTAHWTNWPNGVTGHMDEGLAEVPNMTAWETLTPVGTSSATTPLTSPIASSTGTGSNTAPPVTSSTTTSSGTSMTTLEYAAVIIIVIIVIAGAVLFLRQRGKKT